MVEINISVFKDAADAIDKLVDTVRKIAGLIASAAGKGADLVEWQSARQLRKKLAGIHSRTSRLWIGQSLKVRQTLEIFIEDPREEDWDLIRSALRNTLHNVEGIIKILEEDSIALSTLPFYKDLSVALGARQAYLRNVIELDAPNSPTELAALKKFLERYGVLIDRLGELNDAIAAYIERLKSDGKWPIRGD